MSATTTTTLDYLARGICLLQASQLINSIVNTTGGAKQFLGLSTVSDEALIFFPPLGARNGTIGLCAFILSLRGDRLGVATSFVLSCIPGGVDAVTCRRRGGNWQVHVGASVVLLVVSYLLVKDS